MDYKQFVVRAFEHEPGKWRARISRVDGTPIKVIGRRKIREFVTGLDAKTAPAAMSMAMDAIEAGTFSPHRQDAERFWRFLDRASAVRSDRDVRQISVRPTRRRLWRRSGP